MIKTERFILIQLDDDYIEDYYNEFNSSVTKYQYLDPFENIDEVKKYFDSSRFDQSINNSLHYLIISHDKEFIGSIQIIGLNEDYPEIGLWIKTSKQNQGIGQEILNNVFTYLSEYYPKELYLFSIDKRNIASLSLIKKYKHEFAYNDSMINESGKELDCVVYAVNIK